LSYNPVNNSDARVQNVIKTNICILGGAGSGKSTLINSIASALNGRRTDWAHAQRGDHVTYRLEKYPLPANSGNDSAAILWDVWGWDSVNYQQGEIQYLLDGMLPNCWTSDRPPMINSSGINTTPSINDSPQVVIIVIPADQAHTKTYIDRLREFSKAAALRDIKIMLVLSKCDLYDPLITNAYDQLPNSQLLATLVSKLFNEQLGIEIIPYIGYTFGDVNNVMDYYSLRIINRALDLCEDYYRTRRLRHY